MAGIGSPDLVNRLRRKLRSIIDTRSWQLLVLICFGLIYISYSLIALVIVTANEYKTDVPEVITPLIILAFSYWFQMWILVGLYNLSNYTRMAALGISMAGLLIIITILFTGLIDPTSIPGLPGQIGFFVIYALLIIYVLGIDNHTSALFAAQSQIEELSAEAIEEMLNQPDIAKFIYNGTIVIIGYLLIKMLANDGLPFVKTLVVMTIYLLLILLLEPMEGAVLKSDPFKKDIIREVEEGVT